MTHEEIIEKIRNEYVCVEKTWEAINNKDYCRRGADLLIGEDTLLLPERLYDFFEDGGVR